MKADAELMIVIGLLMLLGLLAIGLGNTIIHLIAKVKEWIDKK